MPDGQTVTNAAELADKWGQRLAEIVSKHGPDAAELALALGRLGAAKHLAQAAAGFAIGLVLLGISAYLIKKGVKLFNDPKSKGEEVIPIIIGGILAFGGGLATALNFIDLLNVFAWAGLYRPEVWLAAKALNL